MQAVDRSAALGLFPLDVHVGLFVELGHGLDDGVTLDVGVFVALGHLHLLAIVFEGDRLEQRVFLRHEQAQQVAGVQGFQAACELQAIAHEFFTQYENLWCQLGRKADFGPGLFRVVSGLVNPPHLVQLGAFAPHGHAVQQLVARGLEALVCGPVCVA